MLAQLEKYALLNNIPIIKPEGIAFLTEYIGKNNIKDILEIGSAIGYSAIKMALVSNDIKIVTIERDIKRYEKAVFNIEKFNLTKQITIILNDAFDVYLNTKFDLIFIDAAKAQNIKFFEKFMINLKPKGVIITDNLSFHGLVHGDKLGLSKNVLGMVLKIEKYIDFLNNNETYQTTFLPIGDGLSISRKKEVNEN
ncbi:MAG: O-methyltransferase [Bacilli bacterium]